ncbi:unnamed protein product [Vitrella brassicaformis CCMP3155]|uniref:Uncharacterized protein n=2 Tax=Vitrella brassicaformis TaxID=1169539 RepID=A0A0G4GK95_VITBC|nr:unnamed protein product [Vitrella brassicaformis CCMP3155]|eukprot:CEM30337.1 unnamed protein product [Vitrella brassicaformis CCMP3155]
MLDFSSEQLMALSRRQTEDRRRFKIVTEECMRHSWNPKKQRGVTSLDFTCFCSQLCGPEYQSLSLCTSTQRLLTKNYGSGDAMRCTPHARSLCKCIKDELMSVLMAGSPHVQADDVRLVDGFDCE